VKTVEADFSRKPLDEGVGIAKIPGIGPQSAAELLSRFRSVARIRDASLEEIATVVGMAKAKKVVDFLHPNQETNPES
jgi:excinuclease UvrABC nuclease subunit